MKIWRNILMGGLVCVLLTACFPAAPAPTATPTPAMSTSEEYVTAAWNAYNASRYLEAIDLAQGCIDLWEKDALEQQSALTAAPGNAKVSEAEKQQIFTNWAINDVGTAYFIMAASLEKLDKTTEAKQAYLKVADFP